MRNFGSADDTVSGLDPTTAAQVGRAAREAFVHALSSGIWLSTGMALAGALAALVLVERGRARAERPVKGSQPAPEAIGA